MRNLASLSILVGLAATLSLGCNSPRRNTGTPMRDLGPGGDDAGPGVDLGPMPPVDMGGGGCVPADCVDTNPCTVAERCVGGTCVSDTLDGDADGFPSTICGGTDCDDSRAGVAPGNAEICNGIDDNCSGTADEGSSAVLCGGALLCTGGMCRTTEVCGELNATCCAGSVCNDATLGCTAGRCTALACAAPLDPIPFGAGAHCSATTRTCVDACTTDACFSSCLTADTTPANATSGLNCSGCVNYSTNQCIDSGGCHAQLAAWFCCLDAMCGGVSCSACNALLTTVQTCADTVDCTGVAVGCFP